MKKCPKCKKLYNDTWGVCLGCSVPLDHVEGRDPDIDPARPVSTITPDKPKKNIEFEIGQYLLNRLGVISLVIGIAFFIAYSFQYIGSIAKILIGFGISGALLAAGKLIETKSKEMKWYGWSLIGGGWALTYFTTYAMHHIEAVRVIQNSNIALILLVLVTSVLMIDLMRYKSQIITSLVFILAYFTAGIDKVSYFSLTYSTLLSFSMIFVIHKMRWNRLMLFTVAAAYISHIWWVGPEILLTGTAGANITLEMSRFLLSAGFLTVCWLLFTAAPLLVKSETEEDRQVQTATTLLNAFFYGLLMMQEISKINPEWRFYAALGLGIISVAAAVYSKYAAKNESLLVTHITLAISFITLSFPMKFMDRWVHTAWLVEIPVLLFLGMYFKRLLYRAVAWALGCLMVLKTFTLYNFKLASNEALLVPGYFLTERSLTTIMLIVAFYATGVIYSWYGQTDERIKSESGIGRAFVVIATLFLAILSSHDIHGNLMSITWIVCAFIFFGVGFLIRDKWFRYLALALIGLVILRLVAYDIQGLPTLYRMALFIGMGIALLGASFVYAKIASLQKKEK